MKPIYGVIFFIVLFASSMLILYSLKSPVQYEVIYMSELIKVEHQIIGPDYLYFSNGRVVTAGVYVNIQIVIGGTYEFGRYINSWGSTAYCSLRLVK